MASGGAPLASADFEATIGLEIHVQLATESKIFCSCRARLESGLSVADLAPNSNSCPICAGHPGTLPVLNRRAVDFAIQAGLATHCRIQNASVLARKNYFYPDLPKGYQISQYDRPICEGGWIEIDAPSGAPRRIRIQRIHLEEDAGKSVHGAGFSLVNLNRAGTPLIEIVTEPDLRSAEEAGAYMRAIHAIVTCLGICDGNMQEGNFRCDANVSVRPRGEARLGTRAEIKNVNSFRFIEKAIQHEIMRQSQILLSGGKVVQETRAYDPDRNLTVSLRSKEEAEDYRYFPDPDLIPIRIDEAWIGRSRQALPELPQDKRNRYVSDLGLTRDEAGILSLSRPLAAYFEQVLALGAMAKSVSNWLTGELSRLAAESGTAIPEGRVTPAHLAELVRLTQDGTLSSTGAKQAIGIVWQTGEPLLEVIEREGLRQVSDLGALEPAIEAVLKEFPSQVAEFKAGKEKVIGFLVGQAMKRMGGKANPGLLQELIRKRISS